MPHKRALIADTLQNGWHIVRKVPAASKRYQQARGIAVFASAFERFLPARLKPDGYAGETFGEDG